jgi:hypothetical protein
MNDDRKLHKQYLDDIGRSRAALVEQIRESQETIERSMELIRRVDELFANPMEGRRHSVASMGPNRRAQERDLPHALLARADEVIE